MRERKREGDMKKRRIIRKGEVEGERKLDKAMNNERGA